MKKKTKTGSNIFLVISGILVIFSFYNIFYWLNDSFKITKLREVLRSTTSILEIENRDADLFNPPSDLDDSSWTYQHESFLEVDFTNLLKENYDTVAYIEVGGTDISYPIVKANDNEYYLTHSFDKDNNKSGWIFLDYRNNFDSLSDNTIIYGHKRKDGTMFAKLSNLLKEDWYKDSKHHLIKISTPTENMIWQIFSVYTIPEESYYIKTFFATIADYQIFLDIVKNRSMYNFNTSVNSQDKILTLSTCYNSNGIRTVIHAKLIKKGFHS